MLHLLLAVSVCSYKCAIECFVFDNGKSLYLLITNHDFQNQRQDSEH